ncbi:hypothetical protein [Rhabdochromatium marinum]|uniref:hypothetical protein n=1 Tax=Rhabdochromatium marinum TaxID=48729 RepID=UPI0019074E3F|nr:hypothetical protein [Rhabdochromatium marinum]
MSNDTKSFELLGEIAKLLKKYGKETFFELAAILKDPNLLDQVANSLEEVASKPIKRKGIQRRLPAEEERFQFRETLIALGKSEPEKSHILLTLFDSLHNKNIFPSLRELIDFISDQGLEVPKTKSRSKVVISFLNNCKALSLSELQQFNLPSERSNTLGNSDRSLEGWGKVILDRNPKKTDEKK